MKRLDLNPAEYNLLVFFMLFSAMIGMTIASWSVIAFFISILCL